MQNRPGFLQGRFTSLCKGGCVLGQSVPCQTGSAWLPRLSHSSPSNRLLPRKEDCLSPSVFDIQSNVQKNVQSHFLLPDSLSVAQSFDSCPPPPPFPSFYSSLAYAHAHSVCLARFISKSQTTQSFLCVVDQLCSCWVPLPPMCQGCVKYDVNRPISFFTHDPVGPLVTPSVPRGGPVDSCRTLANRNSSPPQNDLDMVSCLLGGGRGGACKCLS